MKFEGIVVCPPELSLIVTPRSLRCWWCHGSRISSGGGTLAVVLSRHARMLAQQLDAAMNATEHYLDQAQHLLTEVLPELSARVERDASERRLDIADDIDALSRERARALADRALREAADAEVEGLGRDL